LAAEWSQFDLEAGVWTKPSSHTKQKQEHRVPLSAPALQLLTEMHAGAEALAKKNKVAVNRFLFPGDRDNEHLEEPKKGWSSIIQRATVLGWSQQPESIPGQLVQDLTKKNRLPTYAAVVAEAKKRDIALPAGLTDLRIHDLRHSFASILASGGASLPLIGALLGHTQAQTTHRYSHLLDDALRAATQRVGDAWEAAGSGKRSAEVREIRGSIK
jgi:integrase